jgi:hypothetical protein
MKKYLCIAVSAFVLSAAVSIAGPDKAAVEAKENAAWQSFKDKNADAFQKLVDKDLRAVYDVGIMKMSDELEAMKKWDMKSFTISNFDMFSDEKDVIVTSYVVNVEGTYDGHDMSGMYNAGTVWKMEGNDWLAIFHTNIKQVAAAK